MASLKFLRSSSLDVAVVLAIASAIFIRHRIEFAGDDSTDKPSMTISDYLASGLYNEWKDDLPISSALVAEVNAEELLEELAARRKVLNETLAERRKETDSLITIQKEWLAHRAKEQEQQALATAPGFPADSEDETVSARVVYTYQYQNGSVGSIDSVRVETSRSLFVTGSLIGPNSIGQEGMRLDKASPLVPALSVGNAAEPVQVEITLLKVVDDKEQELGVWRGRAQRAAGGDLRGVRRYSFRQDTGSGELGEYHSATVSVFSSPPSASDNRLSLWKKAR